MVAPSRCLDDVQIYALIHGEIAPAELGGIDQHVDACATCREEVLATARSFGRGRASLRAGERLGRHLIVEAIGAGAFGVVYRAFDSALDRAVAIKLLRPRGDRSDHERIAREARAMARLSHPNVVTVHEVGQAAAGTYLVMELVEGATLREWLLSPRDRAAIVDAFVQAGEGLAAAHDAGLVHRDFKPDNVIVGRDGRVRVTDFGLARGLTEGDTGADAVGEELTATISRTGGLVGTPAYMAPEQLEGAGADARSDQYSFCVALYEALYGHRPVSGADLDELRAHQRRGDLIEPARIEDRALHRVLLRGLERDPAARHQSMRALIGALERRPQWRAAAGLAIVAAAVIAALFAGEPQTCRAGSDRVAQSWNAERRDAVRRAFVASETPFAAAGLATVFARLDAWQRDWATAFDDACAATRLRGEQSEALLDRRVDCLERQRADVDALIAQLAQTNRATVAQAADAVAALGEPSACAPNALLEEEGPPTSKRALVRAVAERLATARARVATGRAAEVVADADAIVAEAEATGFDPSIAEAEHAVADAFWRGGDLKRAEDHALASLWAAQRSGSPHGIARAALLLAAIEGTRGRYANVERWCRQAQAALARVESPALRAAAQSALGVAHTNLGRFEDAERELVAALALRREHFGEQHVDVARAHTNLGNLARARGDLEAARRSHETARAIDRALLGADHPNEARHLHNLARLRVLADDHPGALALYQEALARSKAGWGDDHPDVGSNFNSLGLLFEAMGERDRARDHYERALAVFAGRRPIEEASARLNLGRGLIDGAPEDALEHLEIALELFELHLGRAHTRVAEAELALGDAFAALDRPAEARRAYRRAESIARLTEDPGAAVDHARAGIAALEAAAERDAPRAAHPSAPHPAPARPHELATQAAPAPMEQPAPNPVKKPPPVPVKQPSPVPAKQPAGAYLPGQAWD